MPAVSSASEAGEPQQIAGVERLTEEVENCLDRLETALAARYGGTWSATFTANNDAVMILKGLGGDARL